jgi:ABC-type Fe3+/spermidine/putrescine transport system ATPase subunit
VSLHIEDLTVAYGDTVVLSGIDLHISAGERFAVMGPSGSGKSSLLRAIAGITPATGSITLAGRDIASLRPHERSIGLMFQDFALFPHMSVRDNVAFGLRMRGIDRTERRDLATKALESVGLAGFDDRNPASLSGGEQQRVALARTLVTGPDLLMLDEPLGSLDLSLRDSLLEELRTVVAQSALTTIYVTHDRIEAFAFADRLAVIIDGAIATVGTPTQVWRSPGTVEVAKLIGHPNIAMDNPWADGPVSIPEEAIELEGQAAWVRPGVVTDSLFVDGRFLTIVRIEGLDVDLQLHTPNRVDAGSQIAVAIDTARLVFLSP